MVSMTHITKDRIASTVIIDKWSLSLNKLGGNHDVKISSLALEIHRRSLPWNGHRLSIQPIMTVISSGNFKLIPHPGLQIPVSANFSHRSWQFTSLPIVRQRTFFLESLNTRRLRLSYVITLVVYS